MLFGKKKTGPGLISSRKEKAEEVKLEEFYFDKKEVRKRLKKIKIPREIFVKPDDIDDNDAMKLIVALQGILRYVDRTIEEPKTFNVHKESIANDLKEFQRHLLKLVEEYPERFLSANAKYRLEVTRDAVKRYMERQ